jgi:ElaB/YqjD/DUF883 family membrane-anchored ribosome-binding protein
MKSERVGGDPAMSEMQRFDELVPKEVQRSWDLVRERTGQAVSKARQYAKENPRTAILVSTAAGVALGSLLIMKWRRGRNGRA